MTTTSNNYWTATAAATALTVLAVEKTKMTHVPGFKLTHEERMKKCDQHKYSICFTCDAGLDDLADFTCDPHAPGGFALICNACCEYFNKNNYVSSGYKPFLNASYR